MTFRARAARSTTAAFIAGVLLLAEGFRASAGAAPAPTSLQNAPNGPEAESFQPWAGASFGTYMVPNGPFVADDGGFDLVVHFHAAHMAERAWRRTALKAVVASAAFGIGSGPYYKAFADPARFDRLVREMAQKVRRATGRADAHVRRVGLVAWSAGYGAVDRILSAGRYGHLVDAVILLDALHAGYKHSAVARPQGRDGAESDEVIKERLARAVGLGDEAVETRMLTPFVDFAQKARAGEKLFVFTHSTIRPVGYASTQECAAALARTVGLTLERDDGARAPLPWPAKGVEGVDDAFRAPLVRADEGGAHIRGYAGGGPSDHLAHLPLVEAVVRTYLAPRWVEAPAPVATRLAHR